MGNSTRPAHLRYLGDGDLGAWAPYQFKDALKALPGSRWDPNLRCWRIPYRFEADARQVIDAANGGIDIELAGTFRTLFERVDPDTAKQIYRALARLLHPDAGGDETVMKALTVAWREVAA